MEHIAIVCHIATAHHTFAPLRKALRRFRKKNLLQMMTFKTGVCFFQTPHTQAFTHVKVPETSMPSLSAAFPCPYI